MNFYRFIIASVLLVACNSSTVRAQAFQNLDFENVVLNGVPDITNIFSVVSSVPGWTFSDNTPPMLGPHLGLTPQQFLVTDLIPPPFIPFRPVIQGHFSLYLQEGRLPPSFVTEVGPWIEQTALIPAGTNSVRFQGNYGPFVPGQHPWRVSINGSAVAITELNGVPLPSGLMSADVSAFAGTVATLRIAIDPTYDNVLGPPLGATSEGTLDVIRFSPLAYTLVPEPTSALLALSLLTSASVFHRHKK